MTIMRSALIAASAVMFGLAAHAQPAVTEKAAVPTGGVQTYTLDPMHTEVAWRISHFGFSSPSGKFAQVTGTLSLDEAHPESSKVDATITIANLVTGLDKLNEHLWGEAFFDSKKFPTATFVSQKVDVTGKDTAKVTGNLTLHGVTKPVVLDVKLNQIGMNMMNKKTAGFTAVLLLKRSDFGMNTYVPKLGDEVELRIETEANLKE